MYNWILTRTVQRTEGPNYPARAAQTVDATVAKWIPITAALLACAVTPACAKLDVRSYDWQPQFSWVRPVVDATVRTYIPAASTELQSARTAARPQFDVRQFECVTRVDAQVRTWQPAISAELASFRTDARPSLEVRRYDWDVPDTAWIATSLVTAPTVAQTWPAFQQSALSARTPDRPRLDLRAYEWVFDPSEWQQTATAVLAARSSPAFTDSGTRTRDGVRLDVRSYDWYADPSDWVVAPAAAAAQYTPALADHGARTRDVVRLDLRAASWLSDVANWVAATQTTGPSIAQTAPAWTSASQSGRTPGGATVDLFRAQATTGTFRTPEDWATWVPLQDHGGRTGDRDRLDVRRYDWAAPGWITANVPVTVTTAQLAATRQDTGGRTTERARGDVRAFEWSAQGWMAATLPPTVAQNWPAFQVQGVRTADRAKLDVRAYEWAAAYGALPIITAAQTWPAVVQGAGQSYRSGSRALLDVRSYDWASAVRLASLSAPDASAIRFVVVGAWPRIVTVTARAQTIIVPASPRGVIVP